MFLERHHAPDQNQRRDHKEENQDHADLNCSFYIPVGTQSFTHSHPSFTVNLLYLVSKNIIAHCLQFCNYFYQINSQFIFILSTFYFSLS